MWLLIGLTLGSQRWYLIGTSQVAGNAFSKAVPGGSAAGAALQFRMLADGGIPAPKIAAGLTAVSLINVATLFAMPLFALPAILGGAAINDGLARAAWLGLGAFVLLFAGGAALLLADRPVHLAARGVEKLHNLFLRRKPPLVNLTERLTHERDTVRSILGKRWSGAIVRSIGNVAFDYGALLAALVAVGASPRPSLVLLAYVGAVVIGMFPITPGGLGLVEAGLAGMLVLAGVSPRAGDPRDARLPARVVLGAVGGGRGRVLPVQAPGSEVASEGSRRRRGRRTVAHRPTLRTRRRVRRTLGARPSRSRGSRTRAPDSGPRPPS